MRILYRLGLKDIIMKGENEYAQFVIDTDLSEKCKLVEGLLGRLISALKETELNILLS